MRYNACALWFPSHSIPPYIPNESQDIVYAHNNKKEMCLIPGFVLKFIDDTSTVIFQSGIEYPTGQLLDGSLIQIANS